jgi:hypothetical protein
MAIQVDLRHEACEPFEALEGVFLRAAHLPDYNDGRFPYLRLVDPYGDTVFGSSQMVVVIPELEALLKERPSPEIEAVLAAARKCVNRRLCLRFIGD